jgi:RNA polymerase sigma factor (sigma-70 family)
MESINDYAEFQQYCREIQQYSNLTHEQERELAKRYQQGDGAAGQKIIHANLRFVVKVSRKFFYSGHNCLDIVQEGNLGLIKALERFDPERGIPFIYYAVWWVEATIKAFMQKSGKVHTGSLRHAKNLLSLDEHIGNDDNDKDRWIDFLTDGSDPEKQYYGKERSHDISSLFQHCFASLSQREVSVIKQRFYADPPIKLKEIGMQLGVSRERVRQIQMRSMEKLKQVLENQVECFMGSDTLDSHAPTGNSLSSFMHRAEQQN